MSERKKAVQIDADVTVHRQVQDGVEQLDADIMRHEARHKLEELAEERPRGLHKAMGVGVGVRGWRTQRERAYVGRGRGHGEGHWRGAGYVDWAYDWIASTSQHPIC